MTLIKDKTLLITGGASGIGKLMALIALEKAAQKVIIWDISQSQIDAFTQENKDQRLLFQQVDVSNRASVKKAAATLEECAVSPDILVLNAGIVIGKYFHEHSSTEIEKSIQVNVMGCLYTTERFLNKMISRKNGHIVTIASAAGMLANPRMSVYAASKWAVLGWSDSIRLEMQKLKTGIKVTTVTPSYINTGMFAGAKVNFLLPNVSPETAARKIINGLEKNRIYVRMPALVYLLPLLKGLLPARWFDALIGHGLGVYASMQHFTGRKG